MAQTVTEEQDTRPELAVPAFLAPYLGDRRPNVMQVEALPLVLEGRRNLVIAAPTGSGKTYLAEAALVQAAVRDGAVGVYLCPLRALATEKKEEWERLERAGLSVYKTTGEDAGFDGARAEAAHLLVATPERFDALCRHGLPAVVASRIGLLVVDEVHLVGESGRGPALETLLARFALLFPRARLVAMSGTLHNAAALARWLDADLYESAWRAVRLTVRVETYDESGDWRADEEERTRLAVRVATETLADAGGATLVFCGSRKGTEECALALGRGLAAGGSAAAPLAVAAAPRVEHPTLRQALARGVGFHHAGLAAADRAVVERLYRSRAIRVLAATSTVAAGVNLPARSVVVRDLLLGQSELGASTLLQMAGRAGRSGLESEGLCVVIAPRTRKDRVEAMLAGEPIRSRLGEDLATPLCAEIAQGLLHSEAEAEAWYGRTLHVVTAALNERADPLRATRTLIQEGFAQRAGTALESTPLGRATSDAMIRVATASALERTLAAWDALTWGDPARLDEDLLLAACALPVEFEDLAPRRGDEALCSAVARADARLRGLAAGRVRHLIIAATLLSGGAVSDLLLESPGALAPVVARDLPRYLLFLARRSVERGSGALAVTLAACDLAAALAVGLPYGGIGPLYEVARGLAPAGDARLHEARTTLLGLLERGVRDLSGALPFLPPRAARRLDATVPAGPLGLRLEGETIVASVGEHRRPLAIRAQIDALGGATVGCSRLVGAGESTGIPLRSVRELGRPGAALDLAVRLWLTPAGGPHALWRTLAGRLQVVVPNTGLRPGESPAVGEAELLLHRLGAEGTTPDAVEEWEPCEARLFGRHGQPSYTLAAARARWSTDLGQALVRAPARVREAAEVLTRGATMDAERSARVSALLARRIPRQDRVMVRPPRLVLADQAISQVEAALLGGALLWALGIPARLGNASGTATSGPDGTYCHWQDRGTWRVLDPWPAVAGHAERAGGVATGGTLEEDAVLARYTVAFRRSLPLAQTAARLSAELREMPHEAGTRRGRPGTSAMATPACPRCGSPMRERTGQRGAFWGCSQYPQCRGTSPVKVDEQ